MKLAKRLWEDEELDVGSGLLNRDPVIALKVKKKIHPVSVVVVLTAACRIVNPPNPKFTDTAAKIYEHRPFFTDILHDCQ